MRLPRFFEKKRGERRTGSQVWASAGEAAFHAALLAAGVIVGGLLITGVAVPEWRINHHFIATQGVVRAKGLIRQVIADPPGTLQSTWRPTLLVRYTTDGDAREAWARLRDTSTTANREAALGRLAAMPGPGADVACWYDPSDPGSVVLERGYNWWMWLLTLLLPGALAAFGGSGLLRAVRAWGKSEEHRAVGQAHALAPLAQGPAQVDGFPGLPTSDDQVNSPGTILDYRLPIESPESWALMGFGLFAVVWNAVLVVLAVGAGLDLLGGRIDWLLIALLVPFATVGVAGIVLFVRGLVLATAVGPTQVEVSDHPLRPGRTYGVLVAQGGRGGFRSLELLLELEEQATFRQGTDTRTERAVVWSHVVKQWRDVELSPGARFEAEAEVRLPADAMHSFQSEHNLVGWRFVVRGTPLRWPPFRRVFPVVVFPAEAAPLRPPAGKGDR